MTPFGRADDVDAVGARQRHLHEPQPRRRRMAAPPGAGQHDVGIGECRGEAQPGRRPSRISVRMSAAMKPVIGAACEVGERAPEHRLHRSAVQQVDRVHHVPSASSR